MDILYKLVDVEWRKSGDIKIDADNKMAVILINNNAIVSNLEEIVIHELFHLKLWALDQMIEGYVNMDSAWTVKIAKEILQWTCFLKSLIVRWKI